MFYKNFWVSYPFQVLQTHEKATKEASSGSMYMWKFEHKQMF